MSVTAIKSAPAGRLVSKSVPHGSVTVKIGSGVNETTFTDAVVSGTGYIEICNSAAAGDNRKLRVHIRRADHQRTCRSVQPIG
jgi:hypothetical protein